MESNGVWHSLIPQLVGEHADINQVLLGRISPAVNGLKLSQSIRLSSAFFAPMGIRYSGCLAIIALQAYCADNLPCQSVPTVTASDAAIIFALEALPSPET